LRAVVLESPLVSLAPDAELRTTERGWCARSKRPITIGAVVLEPGRERIVIAGDCVITADGEELELVEASEPPDLATFQLALREVDRIVRERPSTVPCISVVEGRELGSRVELLEERRVYVIGRGGESSLSIADGDASREHCAVERRGEIVHVWDLGSKTGTFMGSQRISDVRVVWEPHTMLRIGKTVLRVTKSVPKVEDVPVLPVEPKSDVAATGAKTRAAPNVLPAPTGNAPLAAVPDALAPAPKRSRDLTKMVIWSGAALLAIFSVAALVWIFR
jgi:hypothetical protein